jgi:hypothetical protein
VLQVAPWRTGARGRRVAADSESTPCQWIGPGMDGPGVAGQDPAPQDARPAAGRPAASPAPGAPATVGASPKNVVATVTPPLLACRWQ